VAHAQSQEGLAALVAEGAPRLFIHFSTDIVFGGDPEKIYDVKGSLEAGTLGTARAQKKRKMEAEKKRAEEPQKQKTVETPEEIAKKEEEKRQKEEQRARDEARRRQREAERKHSKDDASYASDDELTEKELAMFRGYKKTSDGRTTSYFTREQSEHEKALIGNIAPQRLEASAGAAATT